jgi:hypothetical protein
VELATFGKITGSFSPNKVPPFAGRISGVVVTWSLLAVRVGTLNTHGVYTMSHRLQYTRFWGPTQQQNNNNVCNELVTAPIQGVICVVRS